MSEAISPPPPIDPAAARIRDDARCWLLIVLDTSPVIAGRAPGLFVREVSFDARKIGKIYGAFVSFSFKLPSKAVGV